MAYKAHWEPIAGIIRVRSIGLLNTDPAELVITVLGDEGVATLKGVRFDGLTQGHAIAVRECLRDLGFHTGVWHRHEPGGGAMRTLRFRTGLE